MANPTTNYGFVLPTPTDLVTDLPADFEVALQGVDTQMKTNADAATQKATLTTTGDIYYASGASTPARLGIGSSGEVLQVSGGLPAWGSAPAGGMTLLSTTTLSSTSTTISSIDQTYKDLQVVVHGVTMGATSQLRVAPNGSTNITSMTRTSGTGGAATQSANYLFLTPQSLGIDNGTSTNAFIFTINNYASAFRKPVSGNGTFYYIDAADQYGSWFAGGINTTSAITSLVFSNSAGATFSAGTVLIYGVK